MRVDWSAFQLWLEAHDKLSGWAQTAGAFLALVVAIAVPLWQQQRDRLLRRREQAALAHALSLALHNLLHDLSTTFDGLLQLGHMPRSLYHHDAILADHLLRVRDQEVRATTPEFMTLLYTARGTLQIAQRALLMSPPSNSLTPGEREMIAGSKKRIDEAFREAALLASDLEYAFSLTSVSAWRRPMVWLVLRTSFGRSIRGRLTAPLEKHQAERIARGW